VASGISPYTVKFYTNSAAGAFAQAGADVTSAPYRVSLGTPAIGTYHIYATVTDNVSSNAVSATNTFTVASVTEPAVTLGLAGNPMAEAGGVATVTATLSATNTLPVTVNLVFSGTATLTTDYTRSATNIVIAAGSTNGSITLTAVQDSVYENPNETIVVDIDTVVNATESGTQQVTATITDDDAAPTGSMILSQNFSTDPVNYTLPGNSSPFRFDTSPTPHYWAKSDTAGLTVNAGITGSDGPYLGAQNLDSLAASPFSSDAPAQIDFALPVTGYSNLKLSIALAGMPNAEDINFIRAKTDNDGDGTYETTLFDFKGSGGTAYTDSVLGSLTAAFKTFSNIVLPMPTAPDGKLRLRLEMYNDTDSQNEATGIDSIVISATVPHFTVTADPRSNHTGYNSVLSGITNKLGKTGAFHVDVGDFDPPANNRAQIDAVMGASYVWYGPIGNHEAENSTYMSWVRAEYNTGNGVRTPLKNFTLQNGPAGSTETMYSVDIGNAHLVFMNEYWNGGTAAGSDVARDGDVVLALRNWLDADLKATTRPVKLVFGHEPAYLPAGHNHAGDSLDLYPANRDAFWGVLKTNNVSAMINGHTHDYYKLLTDGVWQIDAGNAGNDNTGDGYTFIDVILGATAVQFDVWRDAAKNGTWVKSAESFAVPVPSSEKDITSFTFPGFGPATITGTNITLAVPYGTAVTNLAPTYTLSSPLATCVPVSNPSPGLDFTSAVHYLVTAEDHSTKDYTVRVTVDADRPAVINVALGNRSTYSMAGLFWSDYRQSATPGSAAPLAYGMNTWNQASSGSGLPDSKGGSSAVGFTISQYKDGPGDWGGPGILQLFGAGVHSDLGHGGGYEPDPGTFPTVVISGLDPSRTYDLYLVTRDGGGCKNTFTVGGTIDATDPANPLIVGGTTLTADNSAGNGATWVLNQNYVHFTALLPDSSGNITVLENTLSGRYCLNGFQLQDMGAAVVPAPEVSGITTDGAGNVIIQGTTTGAWVITEKTTNLANGPSGWTPVSTNQVTGGAFSVPIPMGTDTNAFFRVKVQ
jgi:hypothetical protein